MRAFKAGLVESLLLAVMGIAVGFGVNATRTRGSIKPNKNYFALAPTKSARAQATDVATATSAQPAKSGASGDVPRAGSAGGTVEKGESPGTDVPAEASPYQVLSPQEVIDLFNGPDTATGLNVFVDARNDQAFEEGHIPGAVQFFPYEVDRLLDDVMERTNGALRIIVYCNGGECTDSKYACRELLEMGLPDDAVFLFAEGWEAWTAKGMPIATGREEG